MAGHFEENIHSLNFVIANHVLPNFWKLWKQQINLNPKIHVSFSIHHHPVNFNWGQYWNQIYEFSMNSCVAIGEVGINLTLKCSVHNNYHDESFY